MHLLSMQIRKALETSNLTPTQRTTYVGWAFAQALGYQLQLPSSPVESLRQHYIQTHLTVVSRALSDFNEHFVVEVRQILDLVFKLYTMRYEMVYNACGLDVIRNLDLLLVRENDVIPPLFTELQSTTMDLRGRLELRGYIQQFVNEWSKYPELAAPPSEVNNNG